MPELAIDRSPSLRLVEAHFGLGLAGLCAFGVALVAASTSLQGYFFQPVLLGLVHLCALGWLLPIALGALLQLVPVVCDVPVHSERLAWVAFGLYLAGASGVVGHLWRMSTGWGLPAAALLLAASLWLYAANLLGTLVRVREWTLTRLHIVVALLYLLLAATLGLALAWHLHSPYLPVNHLLLLRAHAHAAALGFFGLLIMGVAYQLLELFLHSQNTSTGPGWVAFVAVNAALPLLLVGFVRGSTPLLTGAGGALAGVGILAFLEQVRRIFTRRLCRTPDAMWRLTFASLCYLVAALGLGGVLLVAPLPAPLGERLVLAYGLLALPGFVGSIVIGQLNKIIPFLIWLHHFSPNVGLTRVPTTRELLSERAQRRQGVMMHGGLLSLVAGTVLGMPTLRFAGSVLFFFSCAMAAYNLWGVLRSRPRVFQVPRP
jgi:hypothetical protein